MSDRPAHWLRRNEAVRYPRRLICLDSEAVTVVEGAYERHRLRVAAASFDRIDPATRESAASDELVALDAGELWSWVDSKTTKRERTVVFAHNLGYDLRLTAALVELPRLGWQLQAFSLDSYRCWLRWRRDSRTLLMVDTVSFVGRGLATFTDALGVAKPELPAAGAPLEIWVRRCRSDVALLRALVLRLLGWLESEECGNFRMTGPAQGSAAFRHRWLGHHRLLVHNDTDALAAERRSAYTGRCEVWRWGDVRTQLTEWDFSLAYARLAHDAHVPVRLRGPVTAPSATRLRQLGRHFAVLAEIEVDTDTPLVPTVHEDRILWPAGRFTSTLWDPELAALDAAGVAYTVRRAWAYRRAPLLREWAAWILAQLEGPEALTCPVAQAVVKQWSRSLIGRFGLRYPRWEQAGETPDAELLMLPYVDAGTGDRGAFLRLGRQLLEQAGVEESRDSAPAVMAYIMALARVQLWQAMQTAGLENVAYVDTDALLVTGEGDRRLAAATAAGAWPGLRVKGRYGRARLHAPRQLDLGGEVRVAGLPKDAQRRGRRSFVATTWESPGEALRRHRPTEVVVTRRTVTVRGVDRRRRHLAGGSTAPFTIEQP